MYSLRLTPLIRLIPAGHYEIRSSHEFLIRLSPRQFCLPRFYARETPSLSIGIRDQPTDQIDVSPSDLAEGFTFATDILVSTSLYTGWR